MNKKEIKKKIEQHKRYLKEWQEFFKGREDCFTAAIKYPAESEVMINYYQNLLINKSNPFLINFKSSKPVKG